MVLASEVGLVVIGRNEGERLRRCLASIEDHPGPVVYVDSASTDGSPQAARSAGCKTVELGASGPLTAARARNAGFERLLELAPETEYVQFLDGDCELAPSWMEAARGALDAAADVAAACGRLRERAPDASLYNRLCELEWDGPLGEIRACGGNALLRVGPFREVGGFDPNVVAAEDDELCVRLRLAGYRILRIDAEMGWHDAAMTRFAEWWTRAVRTGYAFAQGEALHGRSRLRHFRREVRSTWLWGVALPAAIALAAIASGGWGLLLLAVYPLLAARIYRAQRGGGRAAGDALLYAVACVVAKFAHALGGLRFRIDRARRRPSALIEYK